MQVVFEQAAPVGQKSQSGLLKVEGRADDGPLFPHLVRTIAMQVMFVHFLSTFVIWCVKIQLVHFSQES